MTGNDQCMFCGGWSGKSGNGVPHACLEMTLPQSKTPSPSKGLLTATQPSTPLDDETVEDILIDLYQTAMLHGEAQANGVLPTQKHREQTIILAKILLSKAYAKQFLELPEMQDEPEELLHAKKDGDSITRNKLRSELRAAVNKMGGGAKSE